MPVRPLGRVFRKLAQWAFYPAVLSGAVGAALFCLRLGLRGFGVVFIGALFAACAIHVFERLLPYAKEWSTPRRDVRTDALHSIVSHGFLPVVLQATCYGSLFAVAGRLSHLFGGSLWPDSWPLLSQLLLALVIADFGAYWGHRWAHELDWLWRFHAIHHSAQRLYWLNAGRFHPVDNIPGFILDVWPLILLHAGDEAVALFTVFTAANGMLRHSNVDARLGRLNWIFSTPDLHRWHHSKVIVEANANYAPNLMIWDICFGTRFLPKERLPSTDIGISSMPDFPTGYFAQLVSPFLWSGPAGP